MQTLGLSDSTPGTENRLKALFWPSVKTASDVDYLGTQGCWVCTFVAAVALVFSLMAGQPLIGLLYFIFYYCGGIGVRERSRYAAMVVALMYLLETVLIILAIVPSAALVVHILLSALLIANVRAIWIASNWNPSSDEAVLPPRLNETWRDKLVDQFPMWFWPRIQILYYIYSAGCLVLIVFILLPSHGSN